MFFSTCINLRTMFLSVLNNWYIKGILWRFLINKLTTKHCVYYGGLTNVGISKKPFKAFVFEKFENWFVYSHVFFLACSLLPCSLLAQCYFSWRVIITRNQWNSVKPLAGMYIVWFASSVVCMRYQQNGNPLIKALLYGATFIHYIWLKHQSHATVNV